MFPSMLVRSSTSITASSMFRFYVYGTHCCTDFEELTRTLKSLCTESEIIFYDLMESKNIQFYEKIIEIVAPRKYFTPLIGVFKNDRLFSIVMGMSREVLKKIIEGDHEGVTVYEVGEVEPTNVLQDPEKIQLLERLFTQTKTIEVAPQRDAFYIHLIIAAAAVDAINPCQIHVFVILLTFVFFKAGKRSVLRVGFAFAIAVFAVYYLRGLGLLKIVVHLPQLKYGFAIFVFVVGATKVVEFLSEERKRVPRAFARRITANLERAMNPKMAFIAGIVTASLLPPCASDPYFIVIYLIAREPTLLQGLVLLAIYNIIIIIPFLVITLSICALNLTTMDLKIGLSERKRWLNLFAGLVIVILACFLWL